MEGEGYNNMPPCPRSCFKPVSELGDEEGWWTGGGWSPDNNNMVLECDRVNKQYIPDECQLRYCTTNIVPGEPCQHELRTVACEYCFAILCALEVLCAKFKFAKRYRVLCRSGPCDCCVEMQRRMVC